MVDKKPGFEPGDDDAPGGVSSEGVRIIGAEEAAEAIERGDIASRRSEAEPKYGDRPARPPAGPRPTLRFPLDASSDPTQIERSATLPPGPPASQPVTGPVEMPHWTEPATGEVPRVVIGDTEEGDDLDAWSSFATSTPRWRNQDDNEWDDAGFEDPATLGGEDTRIGALDTSERPSDEELFSFDELDHLDDADDDKDEAEVAPVRPRRSIFARFSNPSPKAESGDAVDEPEDQSDELGFDEPVFSEPPTAEAASREPVSREPSANEEPEYEPPAYQEPAHREPEYEPPAYQEPAHRESVLYDEADESAPPREPARQQISSRNVPDAVAYGASPVGGGGRNLPTAIVVGAGLIVVGLLATALGAVALCVVVAAILLFCGGEYFQAMRQANYEPVALVGVATIVAAPLAAYWRPGVGLYIVVVVGLIACLGTFVAGAGGKGRVLDSVAVTMLGIVWIGLCGGFGGLMLALPHGRNLMWAAIIATVANDIGAFGAGRALGRRTLSDVSPGKTVEGVVGGGIVTVIVTVALVGLVPGLAPFDSVGHAALLGLAVAVVAPLGDLCQSAVKRDLGIKDMGTVLPGHGGVFDRFDAMLFVLPVTFFLASALKLIGV